VTAANRQDSLTLSGFCHLLDSIESAVERSPSQLVHCYVEDSSPLQSGVYCEIIESVVFLQSS